MILAKHLERPWALAAFMVRPVFSPTYIASTGVVMVLQILVFALSLSQLARIEKYDQYLVPGVVLLSFYSTIFGLIQEVFFFATRAEMFFYTYILPLPRYVLALGFTLAVGTMCIPLYMPYILFLLLVGIPIGSPMEILRALLAIALLMILFSTAVGGLLASMFMAIRTNWRLLLSILILSDILQRFSTAYYPLESFPEAYRFIAVLNPVTHFVNLGQHLASVDQRLLLDPGFSAAALAACAIAFSAIAIVGAQKFAEGGRML